MAGLKISRKPPFIVIAGYMTKVNAPSAAEILLRYVTSAPAGVT